MAIRCQRWHFGVKSQHRRVGGGDDGGSTQLLANEGHTLRGIFYVSAIPEQLRH